MGTAIVPKKPPAPEPYPISDEEWAEMMDKFHEMLKEWKGF
jgi:hypothetical protein